MSHPDPHRPLLSRRALLERGALGFGAVALHALLGDRAFSGEPAAAPARSGGLNAPRPTHFPAKATSVIFLYMDGGVSQVDSFDPKPLLTQEHGKPFKMKMEPTQFNNNGNTMGSPWGFKNYGKSGIPVSDLFPFIGSCADDLTVIRSMTSEFPEHTSANYFLHTGSGLQGRPTMGAWASYGLGSRCQNLPGFIVLNGGLIPPGGLDCFGNGFLPAAYQSSMFRASGQAVANISPTEKSPAQQRSKLELTHCLDAELLRRAGHQDALEAAIANSEMAYAMQASVPELMDLSGETAATKELYGFNAKNERTRNYAAQCLVARRLVERGVRFVELTCQHVPSGDRWDQHSNLKQGHQDNALVVDQPIAGLLKDLKSRGLLDSTLVVFSGEFGRTPFAQGSDGRDHNQFGFSAWLAGGGVKGGYIHGATDEYGYKVVQDKVDMHDLHATMLHLLGMDHKRLTFRYGGRDMRLTDVHGEVVHPIIA
jgi:hypothetical protein